MVLKVFKHSSKKGQTMKFGSCWSQVWYFKHRCTLDWMSEVLFFSKQSSSGSQTYFFVLSSMWFMWLDGLLSDLWNKQNHHGRAENMPLFDKGTHGNRHTQQPAHLNNYHQSIQLKHTHTLTSLSQSACMWEVLYLGLGTASRYFVLSLFHCSSDQKPWRPLACTHTHTHKQTTPQWHSKDIAAKQLKMTETKRLTSRYSLDKITLFYI